MCSIGKKVLSYGHEHEVIEAKQVDEALEVATFTAG
jgi:hypothetical protein